MATALARQIKQDYPGCFLTWAISYKYKPVIENNPYIDAIWEVRHAENETIFGKQSAIDTRRRRQKQRNNRGSLMKFSTARLYLIT